MSKAKRCRLLPMDELRSRPCEVGGGPALFHRWIEEDRVLFQPRAFIDPHKTAELVHRFRAELVVEPGCSTEVLRETFALVEYRDGTIAKVDPLRVRFVDKEA